MRAHDHVPVRRVERAATAIAERVAIAHEAGSVRHEHIVAAHAHVAEGRR